MATIFVKTYAQTDGVAEVPESVLQHAAIQTVTWDKRSITVTLYSLASPDELKAWGVLDKYESPVAYRLKSYREVRPSDA